MNLETSSLNGVCKEITVGFYPGELAYDTQIAHLSMPAAGKEQKSFHHSLDQEGWRRRTNEALNKNGKS